MLDEALIFPSTNFAFVFAARDDLDEEEEDLGEEVAFCFLRFCFFGILGMSVGGISVNMSDAVCRPSLSPKSVSIDRKKRLNAKKITEKYNQIRVRIEKT